MALGLYLHIPFCQSICSYCNFNRGLFQAELADRYVGALATEIERASSGEAADTIFFGGGTPSRTAPEHLERIVSALRRRFRLRTTPLRNLAKNWSSTLWSATCNASATIQTRAFRFRRRFPLKFGRLLSSWSRSVMTGT